MKQAMPWARAPHRRGGRGAGSPIPGAGRSSVTTKATSASVGPREPLVAADPDDPVGVDDHVGHAVDIVDVGEPLDLAGRQPGVDEEEPPVDRTGRQAVVEVGQAVAIGSARIGRNRTWSRREALVDLEVHRIAARVGGGSAAVTVGHHPGCPARPGPIAPDAAPCTDAPGEPVRPRSGAVNGPLAGADADQRARREADLRSMSARAPMAERVDHPQSRRCTARSPGCRRPAVRGPPASRLAAVVESSRPASRIRAGTSRSRPTARGPRRPASRQGPPDGPDSAAGGGTSTGSVPGGLPGRRIRSTSMVHHLRS